MGKYVDKNDVLTWVNIQLRGKATLVDIPDIIIDMAEVKVDSELINRLVKTIPTESDTSNFLKFAAFCFSLQMLCQSRLITQSHGDVAADKFGEVSHTYQKANPMFFFAQGTARGFMALLPYETFRMYAYQFCEAYIRLKYYERTGNTVPAPIMLFDNTSRGWNWDLDDDTYDGADAISESEFGEPDIGDL